MTLSGPATGQRIPERPDGGPGAPKPSIARRSSLAEALRHGRSPLAAIAAGTIAFVAANGDPVVLVGGVRTAIGRFGGVFRDVDAHELGAAAIREALARSGVERGEVDEVVMGQVGQVGADAYNARRCAIEAGIPPAATAMNVNRLCSSGLQAILSGAQEILTGQADVVVAGGDESMSRQPFLDYHARDGYRLGSRELVDGTLSLVTDPFGRYPMGETAERVAERYGVSREEQDRFAARSHRLAGRALDAGWFAAEIVAVTPPRSADPVVRDEHPRPETTEETLASLRPVFRSDGTVTAGNSAGINDGAAAVVLMRESEAGRRGVVPACACARGPSAASSRR